METQATTTIAPVIPNGAVVRNTIKFNGRGCGFKLIKTGTRGVVLYNVEGKGPQAGLNFAIVQFDGTTPPQELRTDCLRVVG